MRARRNWMAALAGPLVLAVVLTAAACGDNDNPDAATALESAAEAAEAAVPSPAEVAGSDEHLNNLANSDAARQVRANEAATARLAGQAERQAQLDAQAELYGNLSADAAAGLADEQDAAQASAAPNAFEAGNRAALVAQADAYVQQQQDRAEGVLPGSHHTPGYVDPRDDVAQPPYVYGP